MMFDKIEGFLEVGINDADEVVVNIPPNKKKREQHKTNCAYRANTEELCNCGIEYEHIVFSPRQARNLALLLEQKASDIELQQIERRQKEVFAKNAKIPVDRSAQVLTDGSPVTDDHREIDPVSGQQKGYVVLSPEERARGFVRPVRRSYIHVGINPKMRGVVLIEPGDRGCGCRTEMAQSIAETYARDPGFYTGTFCVGCHAHRPLDEFFWEGTTEEVGS